MANYTGLTGSTIRIQVTFYDYAPQGTQGTIVDPATVVVNLYDANYNILQSDLSAIKESSGVYHYDWLLPSIIGVFYVEFVGTIVGEPSIFRQRVVTIFDN